MTTETAQTESSSETAALEQRPFGRLGRSASLVGLGCWQLGADWGDVTEDDARSVLRAAVDSGITFFDTADVYGDGRSEKLIGRFLKDLGPAAEQIFVATKIGRRADPFVAETYTEANIRAWVERSRTNLDTETLDLVQLHCPPPAVYSAESVFDVLDALVAERAIAGYGVSVETCEEALTAIARPGVASVQIILNAFRLKPFEKVVPAAAAAGVGIIGRVPLASGLLSGNYTAATTFAENDHRNYNRGGQAFDVGETFSGVDFETGLAAVDELRAVVPADSTLPETALRWILDQPGVTTVIPGARNPLQAGRNAAAGRRPPVGEAFDTTVREVYDRRLKAQIHTRW